MTDLTKTFAAIDSELAGLLSADDATTIDMDAEQFTGYCQAQIELAKAGEDAANRISHLQEVIAKAKGGGWSDNSTIPVKVYRGELSVDAQSRWAEKMDVNFRVPGPEASPAAGAFAKPSGPTGPASNTAAPAGRYMPPATPTSTPAATSEGFIAKAREVLGKADGATELLSQFNALLTGEASEPGDLEITPTPRELDTWPDDMASKESMAGDAPLAEVDSFGGDPVLQ